MDGKVSVIIPIYNVEKYLKRCIDSVISQTYRNLEIILVDDGSTDNCPAICDEYAQKDNRIIVIHKANGGLSDARNAALDIMSGEYVTFVDSDDFIRADMIWKLFDDLCKNKADLSAARCEQGELDKFSERKTDERIGDVEVSQGKEILSLLFDDRFRESMITAWGKLYKKEIFSNIRYPKGKIHEDEFTIHHVLGECRKVVFDDEPLYYYYKRQGSITKKKYTPSALIVIDALEDRISFFEKLGDEQLLAKCYKDYLRRVQFHFYSLKKYYPDETNRREKIKNRYIEIYKKLCGHIPYNDDKDTFHKDIKLSLRERMRWGLFLWMPETNRIIKELCGARKV